jgi:hypothetical protein
MTPVKLSSSGSSRRRFPALCLGILKRQRFANARRNVVTGLALDAGFIQPRADVGKIAAGRNLKR